MKMNSILSEPALCVLFLADAFMQSRGWVESTTVSGASLHAVTFGLHFPLFGC